MSQHLDTTSPSRTHMPFTFPPIPLMSGDTIVNTEGDEHPVTRVRIIIDTPCGAAPVEIDLDWMLGGWWAPIPVVAPDGVTVNCTDASH